MIGLGLPKVSLVWVNYNSMRIKDVVLESLEAVLSLNYPDYEVVIIDNGSSDGSYEMIRSAAGGRAKIIRLDRNRGFTVANNIGFRARSRDSKYVVIVNNDAVPHIDSLTGIVELMEGEGTAATQGIITDWEGRRVDNYGFIVDELLFSHALHRGEEPSRIKEPAYCTFVSGAYSVYSVDAVIRANGRDALFDDHMFAYFDDKVLGMRLWSAGYVVRAYPVMGARHYGSASFGRTSPTKLYLTLRNFLALARVVKGLRYYPLIMTGFTLRRLVEALTSVDATKQVGLYAFARAVIDAGPAATLVGGMINATDLPLKRLGIGEAIMRLLTKVGGIW